ncbi:hypothetical protein [Croceitalea rosinachiae]|uniref:Adhesin n=1 Tax=Croceitalea rosinachiae TaxID=3075596 RepID=A0ABU3A740_9FLAO|nr:hypothetical protein [Croceitalea sp. F388]MDT0605982.1 hypothetical protein [Croceitalea sp. F388]
MKNLKLILLFSFICTAALGQKIIEKNFDYNNQHIDLDVKFARNIEVKTWDKQTVYFKATILIEDDQFIEKYDIDFQESDNTITIKEKAEQVFKAMQNYGRKNDKNNLRYWYNSGDLCKFNYILYVPKSADFKISSINGSMKAERIEGDFTADLINGNIDIKDYAGNLDLSTINGEIDLKVSNTKFVAETIHGDIYADENLNIVAHDRNVGQKVESGGSNFKNRLSLKTINGNMYLRQ